MVFPLWVVVGGLRLTEGQVPGESGIQLWFSFSFFGSCSKALVLILLLRLLWDSGGHWEEGVSSSYQLQSEPLSVIFQYGVSV